MDTGWLAPSGEFIECEPRDHMFISEDIARRLGVYDENRSSDDVLLDHGWIRISFLSFMFHGYVFSHYKAGSDNQKLFLKRFLEEHQDWISVQGVSDLYGLDVINFEECQAMKKEKE